MSEDGQAASNTSPTPGILTSTATMASAHLEQRHSLCKPLLLHPHLWIVVSPEDVDKLYHCFLRIDSDGNGVIERHELMLIPQIASNPLARRLLELFDTDNSGDINFSEFVAGLAIFSAKTDPMKKLRCTDLSILVLTHDW